MPYTNPEIKTVSKFQNLTPYGNRVFEFITYRENQRTIITQNSPRDSRGRLIKRVNPLTVTQRRYKFFPAYSLTYSWVNGKLEPWSVYSGGSQDFTEPYRHHTTSKEVYPDNDALMRLYAKISDYKASMAVTFAERQSTIDMVGDTATNLFNAIRAAKRGNWRKVSRHLGVQYKKPRSKQTSSAWLEYQYGWYPMVLDIYTLANLQGLFAGGFVRAASRHTGRYTAASGCTVTYESISRYSCYITVRDPAVAFSNQIGLVNPGLVAWELVPFSFVLDWFIPIGDYIDQLTALAGMNASMISKSRHIKRQHFLESTRRTQPNKGYSISEALSGDSSDYSRGPLDKLPNFSLTLQNPLSVNRVVSALALARSVKKDIG